MRTTTPEDYDGVARLIFGAFASDFDETEAEVHRSVVEPERVHAIFDAATPVATAGAFTRDLTVPGGVLPAGHVTAVAVAGTYRRRGLLSRLMRAQLAEIRERGEPLAALWASEGAIYGRFGYGPATWWARYEIATRQLALLGGPEPGRLRAVSTGAAELPEIYERVRLTRPGMSSRPGKWWDHRTADVPAFRRGMSTQRAVVYDGPSGPEGYAIWRVKSQWGATGPDGVVKIEELVTATDDAYAALWRFLLDVDLTRNVEYGFAAPTDPLPHLVSDADRVGQRIGPGLWVRVTDVPAALAGRRYAAPVDVVLAVRDELLPANDRHWRLTGDASGAECAPTHAPADLTVDVRALGAAYLGGTPLATMAAAGAVAEHTRGALAAASTAFGWYVAPTAIEIF